MITKLKLIIKKLFKVKDIYFTENEELEKLIKDSNPTCINCKSEIKNKDEIYKIKIKKNQIEYYCFNCNEGFNQ